MKPFQIAFVGYSGSGKTSLIERLIPLLNRRGLRVGTVKHAHHGFHLDARGKDSWRHLKAGARAAAVVGASRVMVVTDLGRKAALDQALRALPDGLDLVLLEGFHAADCPQIAVADGRGRLRRGRRVLAAVSAGPACASVRRFSPSQIREVAALVEQEWMRHWERNYRPRASQGLSSAGG